MLNESWHGPPPADVTHTLLTISVPVTGTGAAVFVIVHASCCPAAMLPIASPEPAAVCIQSSEKEGVKPEAAASLTVKEPGANITDWLPPSVREKDDGGELLPVTCMSNEGLPGHDPLPPDITQDFLINKTPVDGGFPNAPLVFGIPLLTLFAALWSHESDTVLSAPAVSQLVFCLVSCFRILESAYTDCVPVAYIPATDAVDKRINIISDWLWRFVLFARFESISRLGRQILSYVLGFNVFIFVCLIALKSIVY